MTRMNFCGTCAARLPAADPQVCSGCGTEWYRNSKPCSAALVEDHRGRLLLVRRERDPYAGDWDLPGGHCEFAEHPADAAVREVAEETGLRIRPIEVVDIAIYDPGSSGQGTTTVTVYYRAEIVGGVAHPADSEIREIGWFTPREIPSNIAFAPPQDGVVRRWAERAGSSTARPDQHDARGEDA